MSKRMVLLLAFVLALSAPAWIALQSASAPPANPLLVEWTTPFGVPPFQDIKPEHYLPAMKEGIAAQRKEVDTIAANPQPPTFANTIEALEYAGELLTKVNAVFS